MPVFDTELDDEDLDGLIGWLLDGDEVGWSLSELNLNFLSEPSEETRRRFPWVRAAWNSGTAAGKMAARIAEAVNDEEWAARDFVPVEEWARKTAVQLRRSMTEPASPEQIAEALGTLAEVLDQNVAERTAVFIIEMFEKAALPTYVVNAIFERVATLEAGKIKPASFNKLLKGATERLPKVDRWNARTFVSGLEPGLAYFKDRLAEEAGTLPANGPTTRANPALGGVAAPTGGSAPGLPASALQPRRSGRNG